MRFVSLLFVLALSIACGKDSGSGSGSSSSAERGVCDLNGRAVACESIRGADGLGIDLLDVMIDVPVKIQGTEMTFLADRSAISNGRRISCRASVKNGEVYRLAPRGNSLLVMTGEGSYEMSRLNEGEGINGTWVWKGYIEEGTHLLRNMTIVGNNRVIIRHSCEL